MNRYIFLTNSTRRIGGSQLYTARKIDWLEKNGWSTAVYYYNPGPIVINTLKRFKDNLIPQLSLPFHIVSETDRRKIIRRIGDGNYDKTIIESNETHLCIWGEYVAKATGGMNICYPLSESFPPLSIDEIGFFKKKLQANLLFGITDQSIPRMLGNCSEAQNRGLAAVGNVEGNVIEDESYRMPDFVDGKTILSIGRLDKPYIPNMISSIKKFIKAHLNDFFNVVLLGGAGDEELVKTILEELNSLSNVRAFCTGYLHPVPRQLIHKADVAIASAGCVLLSANEKILTVSVDAKDYKAIGIYGITTKSTIYRDSEPQQEIDQVLEDVLYNKIYEKDDVEVHLSKEADYSQHQAIIDRYVGGEAITIQWHLTGKQKLLRGIYTLMGVNNFKHLMNFWNKLR